MSYVNRPLIVVVVQADSTRMIRGTTTIIKKPPERKLKETVKGFSIIKKFIGLIRIRGFRVPQFVRINGIKIASIRWVLYFGNVRRCLTPQSLIEINTCKKRMRLDFVGIFT